MSEAVDNSIEYNLKVYNYIITFENTPLPDTAKEKSLKFCIVDVIQSPSILMATINPYAKEIIGAAWIHFMMIL